MTNETIIKLFNKIRDCGIVVDISQNDITKINNFIKNIIAEKNKEQHYIIDNNKLKKRYYTGLLGELAIEELLNIKFIDWTIGNSKSYNNSDIKQFGIGVKTVEFGKFPLVSKYPKTPEIITLKLSDTKIVICGIATIDVLKTYVNDDLILDKNLRMRNTKSGFYGFSKLLKFSNVSELTSILSTI